MLFKFRKIEGEKGFSLIELLIVISIIGILALIAIPQFSAYKARAHDSDAKANLNKILLACKAYWGNNLATDICAVADVTNDTYGFASSENITVTDGKGTERAFSATAKHASSSKSWSIDANGLISLVP
jgi:type IV pilus assembly protein PilA